jgi:selenocysteine lyase/cysteine desulfurase
MSAGRRKGKDAGLRNGANATPTYDLEAIRAGIPSLEHLVPMNNCSQAPQMDLTRAAAEAYLDSWKDEGMNWDRWIGEVEAARASFARLINAHPQDIAICTSVSQATSSLASAFDFAGERDKVVVTEGEFPTVGQVWRAQERRGARLAWVPAREGLIPIEGYQDLLDEKTLLVSACHAYFQSGFKQDVPAIVEMAREVGALVYVDAYQCLGTEPLDVRALDVDFLASGALKFLMGIPGIAFLYVKPSLAHRLEPAVTGWFGREDPFSFDPRDSSWASGARRFDTGTPPVLEAYVARAAMDFLHEVGLEEISQWTRILSEALTDGGAERGLRLLGTVDPARKAPTTAFLVPGDSHAVEASLKAKGIVASARGPAIRLAPHFYSTMDEVAVALDALAETLQG